MRNTKKTIVAGALASAILITLASAGAPAGAAPTVSPLPCPDDVTLPGSICLIEGVKPITGEDAKPASWRIAFPFIAAGSR